MKLRELKTCISAIERATQVIENPAPEGALGELTTCELNLVRASIRGVMSNRRDNLLDRLKAEGVTIDETV